MLAPKRLQNYSKWVLIKANVWRALSSKLCFISKFSAFKLRGSKKQAVQLSAPDPNYQMHVPNSHRLRGLHMAAGLWLRALQACMKYEFIMKKQISHHCKLHQATAQLITGMDFLLIVSKFLKSQHQSSDHNILPVKFAAIFQKKIISEGK